ncbi:C10orf11 [Branchiostoma lanceolatum]|uniref:C10orf11 protein n=1 Tax=Branchiostoma lanceolatum TaxID=7740 RepID=A0A8J9Z312_BRALA|nr:C10orf11 [Branchiostoma lanceolatum]
MSVIRRSLDGLSSFPELEELIVDNNELDDGVVFPRLPTLHTLMINKNRISFLRQAVAALTEAMRCAKGVNYGHLSQSRAISPASLGTS